MTVYLSNSCIPKKDRTVWVVRTVKKKFVVYSLFVRAECGVSELLNQNNSDG